MRSVSHPGTHHNCVFQLNLRSHADQPDFLSTSICLLSTAYSLLKLLTGLANAAFMAWKLIVTKAIIIADKADTTNTPAPMLTRYSYFSSQFTIKYNASGDAITQLISTSTTKSRDNNIHTWAIDAPSTLRIPTSLVRCSATYAARPNKPRHEINMARAANTPASFPTNTSRLNLLAYSVSTNLY